MSMAKKLLRGFELGDNAVGTYLMVILTFSYGKLNHHSRSIPNILWDVVLVDGESVGGLLQRGKAS